MFLSIKTFNMILNLIDRNSQNITPWKTKEYLLLLLPFRNAYDRHLNMYEQKVGHFNKRTFKCFVLGM